MINETRIKREEIKNPQRFTGNLAFLDDAIAFAVQQVKEDRTKYVHRYPTASSENLMYGEIVGENGEVGQDWTCGFWTGMLWLSYELTGDEVFRAVAEAQFDDYEACCEDYGKIRHHDIGFLYIPSVLAQYKLTGRKKARELALKAAQILSKRFCRKAGIIHVRNWNGQGNFIIDCCMNVPLLFWAGMELCDRDYIYMAYSHLCQSVWYMVRDDASTYQCFQIDEVSGEPVRGWQSQGYSDDSCWARGQEWMLYGLAIGYGYTQEPGRLSA